MSPAKFEGSVDDDADNCIFGGGDAGGFEGVDADFPALETDHGTDISAETEWEKVYNLLSNSDEYPVNTARYLLAKYKESSLRGQVIVEHALYDDLAKET